MLFEWHLFNVSKKFKVQRSLNIVCIVCKMLVMFQQEHFSIPCFKYVRGDHAPMTHVLFLHEFMGMPCHTLSDSKLIYIFKNLSWKRCTYFINYFIEYIWPLTCWLFILCCLSTIFFCVNFQKTEKNKIKKEIFYCWFSFYCWEKIAKFWKKTRKKFNPISLYLHGFGYRLL